VDSVVSMKPGDWITQCKWDRVIGSRRLNEILEIFMTLWDLSQKIIIDQKSRILRSHETAGNDFGGFRIEYLDEYEAICEMTLAVKSGP
jgi:hypothetical protein